MSFPKCQSTLREREREENNDFKFKLAVEKSQKTAAVAAAPHNIMMMSRIMPSAPFQRFREKIKFEWRERERAVIGKDFWA